MKCNFCDQNFSWKFGKKHENSKRHNRKIKIGSTHLVEGRSPQRVRIKYTSRFYDICFIRISTRNTTRVSPKKHKKEVIESQEIYPIVSQSESDFQTIPKASEPQIINAKVSNFEKVETHFLNTYLINEPLEKLFRAYFDFLQKRNLNTMSFFDSFLKKMNNIKSKRRSFQLE